MIYSGCFIRTPIIVYEISTETTWVFSLLMWTQRFEQVRKGVVSSNRHWNRRHQYNSSFTKREFPGEFHPTHKMKNLHRHQKNNKFQIQRLSTPPGLSKTLDSHPADLIPIFINFVFFLFLQHALLWRWSPASWSILSWEIAIMASQWESKSHRVFVYVCNYYFCLSTKTLKHLEIYIYIYIKH